MEKNILGSLTKIKDTVKANLNGRMGANTKVNGSKENNME